MTNYAKLMADQAIYTPSLPPSYARLVVKDPAKVRNGEMPAGLKLDDLNFLDAGSSLLHIDHVLYSAGHAMSQSHTPCMITERHHLPNKTTVIGDSGGYQLITGAIPWQGDKTRRSVLDWLEAYCDVGMILDIPTNAIKYPNSGFKTFAACLNTTLTSLAYFQQHRTPGRIRLLNILQGKDRKEADIWYDAVKAYPFEGWAFAGPLRLDFCEVLRRLVTIRDDGYLADQDWLHFLGTGTPEVACALTTIQSALRKNGFPNLKVTFDSSSPFYVVGKTQSVCTGVKLSSAGVSLQLERLSDTRAYVGSPRRFPFDSAIGRRLKLGDICVNAAVFQNTAWDELSGAFLSNHNLDYILASMDQVSRICDLETRDAAQFLPAWLLDMKEIVPRVFASETPMKVISRNKRYLTALVYRP